VSPDEIQFLAERLQRCGQIARLDGKDYREAWTIVHSLSDLGDAATHYLSQLPALFAAGLEGDDLIKQLMDLLPDLQHMLYHLEDPRFFRQFLEPLRAEWEKTRSASG
jgi:uncharacterized protein YecE (DUF72 family)